MTRPDVSIVVPTYQRRASLEILLSALEKQSVPASSFEVVVSVDGSTDGTLEMLASRNSGTLLRVVDGENRGRASACNSGVEAAQGELVILLDDDMEPTENFVLAHRSAHQDGVERVVVGAVPFRNEHSASALERHIAAAFNRHIAMLSHPTYKWRVKDFYSGNVSLPRRVFFDVGKFDPSFNQYGNEDLELAARLQKARIPILFDASAVAYQHNHKSFRQLVEDRRSEGKTAVLMVLKHPELLSDTRLGWYSNAALPNKLVRRFFLAVGSHWRGLDAAICFVESVLARLNPPGLEKLYPQMLGLFFWLGAREELRQRHAEVSGCESLHPVVRQLRPW